MWTLTKAQRGALEKPRERTQNINQIAVLDAITCLQVGTSMYWFLQLSFYHIRRDQNNLLGQFILFAALADHAGKCRLKWNVRRGYAQALWGKEGQGSMTVALILHPSSSRPHGEAGSCSPGSWMWSPHIYHFYWGGICPRATKSVPSFPPLLLPSSILCFCEKERSPSVELGRSFSGRQGSAKHFQLPQYETDFPWEPIQTASKTRTVLEETYQQSLLSHQKNKNISENSSVGKNDFVDFISFDK